MKSCIYKSQALPDIDMYGGDTTPWEITIQLPVSDPNFTTELSSLSCVFTLTPYRSPMAASMAVDKQQIVLQKNVSLNQSTSPGIATALIDFSIEDTCCLSGKYIYQIAITNDIDLFIAQGKLLIKTYYHKE